jgi:hypothetical protein
MGLRADRKKAHKKFKVGDRVTWGNGVSSHLITEVTPIGVYVDAGPGFRHHFVEFVPSKRYGSMRGPLTLVKDR